MRKITLSTIPKTWIIDIDGVIFQHNGYLTKDGDQLIVTAKKLFEQINSEDYVMLVTSRKSKYRQRTINALKKFDIQYKKIIFDLPHGERIVINDRKRSGLKTAIAMNTTRDKLEEIVLVHDKNL